MSVIPVSCDKDGMQVRHHEHSGRVKWSDLRYSTRPDGGVDRTGVSVPCPAGDAISWHPITGGADADAVEKAFVYGLQWNDDLTDAEWKATGLPGNKPMNPPLPWGIVKAIVKAAVLAREPGRWRLENLKEGE